MKRTPNKNLIKRDYLGGMTPTELGKKYKRTAKQMRDMIAKAKWAKEKSSIGSKVASLVVQSEVEAITAMKSMERKDMQQLLEYARNMVDPFKPSAFKVKVASDVMKTAYERLYKSHGIADRVESTVENLITLQWPE